MLEVTATGKNIEKAIEDALLQLKASREDVDIKILEEGGLFKKAKVFVKISDDCITKYDKHRKLIEEEIQNEKTENIVETLEEKDNSFKEPVIIENVDLMDKETDNIVTENEQNEKTENIEESTENKTETEVKEVKTLEDYQEEIMIARKFISEIAKHFNTEETEVKAEVKDDNNLYLTLIGPKATELIGYRGECLNSIQNILNILLSTKKCKAYLNIENYKERREETLVNLAKRNAKKVLRTKKSIKLDPMNSYERRIIHSALTDFSDIVTYSTGEEPKRCVVICYRR